MEQPTNNRAVGIAFLVIGVAFTTSMAATQGPAFIGIGLPFIIIGLVFMGRSKTDGTTGGDD